MNPSQPLCQASFSAEVESIWSEWALQGEILSFQNQSEKVFLLLEAEILIIGKRLGVFLCCRYKWVSMVICERLQVVPASRFLQQMQSLDALWSGAKFLSAAHRLKAVLLLQMDQRSPQRGHLLLTETFLWVKENNPQQSSEHQPRLLFCEQFVNSKSGCPTGQKITTRLSSEGFFRLSVLGEKKSLQFGSNSLKQQMFMCHILCVCIKESQSLASMLYILHFWKGWKKF